MNIHSQNVEKNLFIKSKQSILDTLHDNVRKSVEISIKQLENGEYISHEEVMKKIKLWQTNNKKKL